MEYLEQAFNDLWEEDALLVMAKGLGIKRIIAKFLRVYSETPPDGVVMCLNVTQGSILVVLMVVGAVLRMWWN